MTVSADRTPSVTDCKTESDVESEKENEKDTETGNESQNRSENDGTAETDLKSGRPLRRRRRLEVDDNDRPAKRPKQEEPEGAVGLALIGRGNVIATCSLGSCSEPDCLPAFDQAGCRIGSAALDDPAGIKGVPVPTRSSSAHSIMPMVSLSCLTPLETNLASPQAPSMSSMSSIGPNASKPLVLEPAECWVQSFWSQGPGPSDKDLWRRKQPTREVDPTVDGGEAAMDRFKVLMSEMFASVGLLSTVSSRGVKSMLMLKYMEIVNYDPPIFCIAFNDEEPGACRAHENILDTKEATLNLICRWHLEAVTRAHVARDPDYDAVNWQLTGLTPTVSSMVKPPLVSESALSIEARLLDTNRWKTDTESGRFCLVKAVMFHVGAVPPTVGTDIKSMIA